MVDMGVAIVDMGGWGVVDGWGCVESVESVESVEGVEGDGKMTNFRPLKIFWSAKFTEISFFFGIFWEWPRAESFRNFFREGRGRVEKSEKVEEDHFSNSPPPPSPLPHLPSPLPHSPSTHQHGSTKHLLFYQGPHSPASFCQTLTGYY
jgi:hypothetical protein